MSGWTFFNSLMEDGKGWGLYMNRTFGIRERFERVMLRNGWVRLNAGKRPWFKP